MHFSHSRGLLLIEPNAHHQRLEDCYACLIQSPEELRRKRAEAGKECFGQPDGVRLGVLFASDLIAFLGTARHP